jgi:hypothetical protein
MISICLALTTCQNAGFASEKMPPHSAFFSAKSLAIVNETGHSEIADRAYDELKKWGRYKIIESPSDADLILVMTTRQDLIGFQRNTSTNTYATVYGTNTAASGSSDILNKHNSGRHPGFHDCSLL